MKKSQEEIVAEHLLQHKTINTWDAIMDYSITRLGAKIWELRHNREWLIDGEHKEQVNGKSRYVYTYKAGELWEE